MTAREALRSYGWPLLVRVAEDGSAPLITRTDEPASTLKDRRTALNLAPREVARSAGVPTDIVEKAEVPGNISPVRSLERIAQALALKEHLLGYIAGAQGDAGLGVRLREFSQLNDTRHFSPSDVLALAEAAWVVSTQSELARLVEPQQKQMRHRFVPDGDYSYPTYRRGYLLASKTRELLNISAEEPIQSLKQLVEETLGIPVVQHRLAPRFAGATLANRTDRGIVVNEQGQNENVWVRRMTIAHEMGHLLWDPDTRLNKLKVDQYDDVASDYNVTFIRDPVEIRTNAFAISFLAPGIAIERVVNQSTDLAQAVGDIMITFGISATAAKYHVKNVSGRNEAVDIPSRDLPPPSDDWVGRENFTVDWFPLRDTPISRRGRFALLVSIAFRKGLISADTGAMYLRCTESDFASHAADIITAYS